MSGSSVSIVLILKKDSEDEFFLLNSEFPSNFAAFHEKISLRIEEDLPLGYTFTLKYKKTDSDRTFRLCNDGDVNRVLLEPSSFEILVFPSKPLENISLPKNPALETPVNFVCNDSPHQIEISYLEDGETFISKLLLSPNQICDTSHFITSIEESLGFKVSKAYYIDSATNTKYILNNSSRVHDLIHQYYKFVVEKLQTTANLNRYSNYLPQVNPPEKQPFVFLQPRCRLPTPGLFTKFFISIEYSHFVSCKYVFGRLVMQIRYPSS
ncbi:hypothetical protein HK096_007332 [Nowakowskiella sp. JEL0078]|nr:hypothetical protein HK096_007332 [Nowakowskiella sp. JEL0078]